MDKQQVKLIAVDMDGTLLNSKKELPADFYDVFSTLKTKGILFSIASGRQYYNLAKQFAAIKDDLIFIAENGSYVVHKDQEIFVQPMEKSQVTTLVNIARSINGANIILCGRKQAYIESDNPEFLEHVYMYYDKRKNVADLLQVQDDDILKIAIFDANGSEKNSYPHFKPFEKEMQVKVSGAHWLDLSDLDANKGNAIKALQHQYQISYDETMVFGDYLNDLEMMAEAKYSYAMENAHPAVKEVANYTTVTNDEDGVMQIIRQLV